MGDIKNSRQFAEFETTLDSYFKMYLSPVMNQVKQELQDKQLEELAAYQSTPAGILASANPFAMPIDDMNSLKIKGDWNSKTTEDYVEMCNSRMSSNKKIINDVNVLSSSWRELVIGQIGEKRYNELSQKLGNDLAISYVDHRIQQLMVDRMIEDKVPKSSLDYIIQKTADTSMFSIPQTLFKSPLEHKIDAESNARYNPSSVEQATGSAIGVTVDALASGGAASWSSLAKFLGLDFALNAVLSTDSTNESGMSVEECISSGVFDNHENVFLTFRQEGKYLSLEDSEYSSDLNNKLTNKILFPQFKTMSFVSQGPSIKELIQPLKRDEKYKDVPLVVAPGQEEAYLKEEQNKSQTVTIEQTSETVHPEEVSPEKLDTQSEPVKPERENSNGWAGMLSTLGLQGFSDITKNLGYVFAMLPDMLVGLFTGKTKSLLPMNNLLPLASIVGGLFVKSPVLKMLLIGLGGANLLNKAGQEAFQQRNNSDNIDANTAQQRFKVYKDEPLNARIQNPLLQGNCLIATIDRIPYSISLPNKVVEAYKQGALPLNTLANAVLARNEQMSQMAQEKYDNANNETLTHTRGIQ